MLHSSKFLIIFPGCKALVLQIVDMGVWRKVQRFYLMIKNHGLELSYLRYLVVIACSHKIQQVEVSLVVLYKHLASNCTILFILMAQLYFLRHY